MELDCMSIHFIYNKKNKFIQGDHALTTLTTL